MFPEKHVHVFSIRVAFLKETIESTMIHKLLEYFREPYRVRRNRPWRIVWAAVSLVVFVLGVFQPFGIGDLERGNKLITICLSGLGSLSGLVIMFFLFPRLFPRYYATEHWTAGKHVLNQLAILLMIGLCTWAFLVAWMAIRSGTVPVYWFELLWKLVVAVFILSPIPLAVTEAMLRNQHLHTYLQEVEEMNRRLTSLPEGPSFLPSDDPSAALPEADISTGKAPADETIADGSPVVLSGSTKDSLSVIPADLLYVEACGNYVKIAYEISGKVKQKLLRATIRQMEDVLSPYPSLLRCHRAFLVNLDQVARLQGNSQGYRLFFRQTADEVPVSRAYTATVRERVHRGGRMA